MKIAKENFINEHFYEKPFLKQQKMTDIQSQIENTLPTYKKPSNIKDEKTKDEEINKIQNENEKPIEDKNEDQTDKLLNISYVKEIFSENNTKFLENFEFIESIKAGSAGAVLKARYRNKKNPEKIVACKIIPKKIKNKSEKNLAKAHKEVLIHRRFHHKNIPEIYGYHPVGDNYSCMVMEFNRYGDLDTFKRNVIKRSCLTESLICYLAGGILDALFYLNKKKTIHMDIKQQNILIDDFLNIKLTDYSVSVDYSKEQNYIELPMVGTCYYMSPEVLERKKIPINEASKIDIYSFGVLLYLLAFNDYPYELDKINCDDYRGIYNNIKQKNIVFPKDTGHSEIFKNFLKKCLNKDIKQRYNIYQAINDPWMKGYQLIVNEKENLYNAGKFMIELLVDNIKPFNDYIK